MLPLLQALKTQFLQCDSKLCYIGSNPNNKQAEKFLLSDLSQKQAQMLPLLKALKTQLSQCDSKLWFKGSNPELKQEINSCLEI